MQADRPSQLGGRRTVSEEVYRALKRDILTLEYRPGMPLREQELAEKYGSSRVPVREACRRLQQEGLVEGVPYRGYFAGQLSLKEIRDSFELRRLLEAHSVDRAAALATPDGIARLEELSGSEYTHSDWASYTDFLDRNLEYHVALAELSGNSRLVRLLTDLIESMQRYFFLGLDLGDYGAEMRTEHEQLTRAIQEGSPERAVRCVQQQIDESRERILTALMTEVPDLPIE